MKVVILCGGQGTRFREQTERKPKPMIEIGGRPILWHIMKSYAGAGVGEFVLCLGYMGDAIKRYFLDFAALESDFTVDLARRGEIVLHDSAAPPWKVTCADTGEAAMTGARLKKIERYIDGDTFLCTYGDGVSDVDVKRTLEFHRQHGKIATVTGVRPQSRFGELIVDGARVTRFSEKPNVEEGFINGGFFVLDRRVFDYLTTDDACVFEREPLERLAADGQLMVYKHDGYWQCMDTYRDLVRLEEAWQSGRAPWRTW